MLNAPSCRDQPAVGRKVHATSDVDVKIDGRANLDRMHAVGFGASRPLADGEKDPGLNRRVNIKLSKSR